MPPPEPPALAKARALITQGHPAEAQAALRRFLARDPSHATANFLMGSALTDLGQAVQAAHYLERAVRLDETNPQFHTALSLTYYRLQQPEPAVRHARRAAALDPSSAALLTDLGSLCVSAGLLDEGETHLLAAAKLDPSASLPHIQRSDMLLSIGEPEAAVAPARHAVELHPESYAFRRSLATLVNYPSNIPVQEVVAVHHATAAEVLKYPPLELPPLRNTRDPNRPLRIGILSPDLIEHSVTSFFEPLVDHLDQSRFRLYAYFNSFRSDYVTARLKRRFHAWRDVLVSGSQQIAAMIRADEIDIAIELAGHTENSALFALRGRVCPVQVTYLGYPATTGLPTIDYRLVDTLTDPPGSDHLATEKLLRLDPCFLCYRPPDNAPEPSPPPCLSSGSMRGSLDASMPPPITFGSFNFLGKLSQATREMWVRLLREVPHSRLLLKDAILGQENARLRVLAHFEKLGVDPARLILLGKTKDRPEHLALYSRVDIALDPTPYNGTTTTCEALWMGVPVVTLAGDRHSARVGLTLLTNIGLSELVAKNPDDYLRIAKSLAQNPAHLASLRSTIRDRVRTSPLCDGPAFARRFEQSLLKMWQTWCASAP